MGDKKWGVKTIGGTKKLGDTKKLGIKRIIGGEKKVGCLKKIGEKKLWVKKILGLNQICPHKWKTNVRTNENKGNC